LYKSDKRRIFGARRRPFNQHMPETWPWQKVGKTELSQERNLFWTRAGAIRHPVREQGEAPNQMTAPIKVQGDANDA
jgi:hypothetical protein